MLIINNVSAAAERAAVRNLAGVELALAAAAATSSVDSPHSQAARRAFGRWSAGTRRTLAELGDRLPNWASYVSNTFYRLESHGLDEALAALAAQDPRDVAGDMVRACCSVDSGSQPIDDVLARLEADSAHSAVARRLQRVISRPEPYVVQMVDVLTAFVRSGFEQWWDGQRETASRLADSLKTRLTADLPRTAALMSPRVIDDRSHDRLVFLSGGTVQVVDGGALTGLDLLPSRWLGRRIAVQHTSGGRVGIAISCGPTVSGELEQLHVPTMLATLGEHTRFEILRLCMLTACTTSELAPALGITEGPVSRHLKELQRCGLVTSERNGRYVRYSTSIEVVSLLGQRLQRLPQHLFSTIGGDGPDEAPAA